MSSHELVEPWRQRRLESKHLLSSVVSKISDGLYMSGLDGVTNDAIKKHKITQVIRLCPDNYPELVNPPGVMFTSLPLKDIPSSDILQHFDLFSDQIEAHRLAGGRTLVHCFAGVSRSATVVIAYLIKYRRMSAARARLYAFLRRGFLKPNSGFLKQLRAFEDEVRTSERDV